MREHRLSKQAWAMQMALLTGKRSTCYRRQVGCVLVDKDYYVLATGFNGPASGMAHCNESAMEPVDGSEFHSRVVYPNLCSGAQSASGSNLDGCHAIHAEQNALIRCRDPREIYSCYVTSSPCMTCTKLLLNTGCQQIWFRDAYAHTDAEALWESSRGPNRWNQLP